MFRKTVGKGRFQRGQDLHRARGHDSAHSISRSGDVSLVHHALDYDRPDAPARKRPRVEVCDDDSEPVSDLPAAGPSTGLPRTSPDLPPVEDNPPIPAPVASASHATLAATSKPPKNKKAPSIQTAKWIAHEDRILRCLLSREHDSMIDGLKLCPRACGRKATTRCLECGAKEALCEECCVADHRSLYFHWVDKWNGKFFERKDLADLGLKIYLGHRDDACPNIPTRNHKPTYFVITHTNGIHRCSVEFCHCAGRDDVPFQLISAGLWPGTLDMPETAFTEAVLRTWHLEWNISHKSAQDYWRVLVRLTNNTDPGQVEDRYRDFMHVARMWRHFAMVKRSGRHHGLVLPHRDPRCIAVPCFTCPWDDFNLPEDWKTMTPEELGYIHRFVCGMDGNNKWCLMLRNQDENDKSVAPGEAFFIDHDKLKPFLKTRAEKDKNSGETCSGFKVGRAQRAVKFRFMKNSGVVAVTCRHVLFRAGAVADMDGGESFDVSDAALQGGIRGTETLKERALTYDVICIYIRNLIKRFKDKWPELVALLEEMLVCLPSMHLHAHKDLCQLVYALAYSTGFGLTHGEGVETPWAEFNIAGLSTREMTAGARHDALNDLMNFWNWLKVEKMVVLLPRKLSEAYAGQRRTTQYFAGLTALNGAEAVAEWLSLPFDYKAPTPLTFKAKEAAFANSPFLVDRSKLPSAQKAYEDLVVQLQKRKNTSRRMHNTIGHAQRGYAKFLLTGIELEAELLDLRERQDHRKAVASGDAVDGDTAYTKSTWKSWQHKVDVWRADQSKYMPALGLQHTGLQGEHDSVATSSRTQDTVADSESDSGYAPDDAPDDGGSADEAHDAEAASADSDSDDSESDSSSVGTSPDDPLYPPNLDDTSAAAMKEPGTSSSSCTRTSSSKPTTRPSKLSRSREVIGLPSDFNASEVKKYELNLLAQYELKLRIGQAFDQLDIVRQSVKNVAAFVDEKKATAQGTRDNMRANTKNKNVTSLRDRHARRYNHIYDRIVGLRASLGLSSDPSDPSSNLRRIDLNKDLTVANLRVAREQGDSKRSGSWIWSVFEDAMSTADGWKTPHPKRTSPRNHTNGSDQPQAEQPQTTSSRRKGKHRADEDNKPLYTTWLDRSQWFRAWQEKIRFDEAVNIHCAEFRATIRGFLAFAKLWLAAAESGKLSAGERAYAYQHYEMFKTMSEKVEEAYEKARTTGVPADKLDHSLSIRSYLAAQTSDMGRWEDILKKLKM